MNGLVETLIPCDVANARHLIGIRSVKVLEAKVCLFCHTEFIKGQREGNKRWSKRRYCSRPCVAKAIKGLKLSEETRQNMSAGQLGKKLSAETKQKIGIGNTGKKRSLATKLKLSIIASARKLSDEHKAKIGDALRGGKHPNWKGGITYPIFALRKTKEYRHWRNAVLERDGYRCRKCHRSDSRLHSHHIFSFTLFPELRFEVSNGITACVRCHTKYKDILCQLVLV